MGITLKSLKSDLKRVKVQVGEDEMEIGYRPHAYTPRLESEAAKAQGGQQAGPVLITILSAVLASWELEDDKGKGLPITAETLSDVPMPVLTEMLRVIGEDMNPTKKTNTRSESSF